MIIRASIVSSEVVGYFQQRKIGPLAKTQRTYAIVAMHRGGPWQLSGRSGSYMIHRNPPPSWSAMGQLLLLFTSNSCICMLRIS